MFLEHAMRGPTRRFAIDCRRIAGYRSRIVIQARIPTQGPVVAGMGRRAVRYIGLVGLICAFAFLPASLASAAGVERDDPFTDFAAPAKDQYGHHHKHKHHGHHGHGNGNGNDPHDGGSALAATAPGSGSGPPGSSVPGSGPGPEGGQAPSGGGNVPVNPRGGELPAGAGGGVLPIGAGGKHALPFTGLNLLLLVLIGLLLVAAGALLRAGGRGWRRARLARPI